MLKQWNRLTSIDVLSWLGGPQVTRQTEVREFPGSIPVSGINIYICFFVLLLCFCYIFVQKNHYKHILFAIPFCNVNLFSIQNILQNVWLIIRVQDTDLASVMSSNELAIS